MSRPIARMCRLFLMHTLVFGIHFGSTGCRSSTSTLLYRDLADLSWHRKTTPGVPITLEVPTYLKLTIVQQQFLDKATLTPIKDAQNYPLMVHDVRQEILNTRKIFTVDLKRPAAGPWESETEFTDKQYFAKIKHKGEDKTIETVGNQVNDLLKNIAPLIPKVRLQSAGEGAGSNFAVIENVVKMGIFKLEDPELELKVTQFVCEAIQPVGPIFHAPRPAILQPANQAVPVPNPQNPAAAIKP